MKQYLADMGRNPNKESRKLMASLSAEIILLYAPLLEWLVDHGLKIKLFTAQLTTNQNKYSGGLSTK